MSTYRVLSNGQMTSSFQCPICYDTLNLLYTGLSKGDISLEDAEEAKTTACCAATGGSSPILVTIYVAQGSTFANATMFYGNTTLNVVSRNGYWTENVAVGSRVYRQLSTDPGGTAFLGGPITCSSCP
jgi:hypothetical protein